MKWLLWILLLANVMFFSFIQWGELLTGENENLRHQSLLNEEKIMLLAAPSAETATSQDPRALTDVCLEWGGFSNIASVRATAALVTLKLADKLTKRQSEYVIGHWVYLPPTKTRAKMKSNIAELKRLKVKNYYAVKDTGQLKNAISLGMFKTEKAARKELARLRAKGVKTAVMGERMSKSKHTTFILKSPDETVIEKMLTLQNKFAGSTVHLVACN